MASPTLGPLGTEFMEDRQYLKNVTEATLQWYRSALRVFDGCEVLEEYNRRIKKLRAAGRSPVSINTWVRAINAYHHWRTAPHRKCSPACEHLKIPKLQVEDKILQTFSPDQIKSILSARPSGSNNRRIQVLAVLILDTGLRLSEALGLRRRDVDLDNLLVRVMGKGRKERLVPLSLEGRKWLYLWTKGLAPEEFIFHTESGSALSPRNSQRDLRIWCRGSLKITNVRASPHTLRHTMAVSYLKNGGNLEFLRRILGHTSILITQRYLRSLTPDDLGRVHNSLSPLSQLR